MSIDRIDVAQGDAPLAGPSVSLEQFADFSALTQSSRGADITSMGFPDLAVNVEDLISRCRTAGPDSGSCVKSVRRQLA